MKHYQARGSASGMSKLTNDQVVQIIQELLYSKKKVYQIAIDYNVDQTTISCINVGTTWNHILPDIPRTIRPRPFAKPKE